MAMQTVALSDLLGVPVLDSSGTRRGRIREVALYPHEDRARISALIVRTSDGDRVVGWDRIRSISSEAVVSSVPATEWQPLVSSEGLLFLERDLLDRQIIDVHGRKVVRVNDIDLAAEERAGHPTLAIAHVEIGTRGAVRRLLKGLTRPVQQAMVARFSPKTIPWDFVDLIETDPARRVRLKIGHEKLQKLHPADLADILEDLAPAQREAVFESLDEDVAADALEEIDPKMQVSLLSSLDSERAANIVEEMDPDAAANLLADLPEARSEEILEEMQEAEREDVEELLEFEEDTAAGHMTTDYIAASPHADVATAIQLLREYEGGVESVHTIFLVDAGEHLIGTVPLSRIALAEQSTQLVSLSSEPLISCALKAKEAEVAELFDKYNLTTLPVIDLTGKLMGVITADDVISLLRKKI